MIIKDEGVSLAGDIGPPDFYDGTLCGCGAFQGELGIFLTSGDRKIYTSATDIVPKASSDIVLPTRDTYVESDITVRKVPSYQTENASGGKTVYIASD